VQVQGQAAQVPGVNGAGSKTGAEPAPRIGLLRCSGGASFGPKKEPAPFMAEPAPSGCQWAFSQLPSVTFLFATIQKYYIKVTYLYVTF
jgi:hypothetical protein